MTKQAKGLRAALRERKTRTTWYDLPVEEYSVCVEKTQQLGMATQTLAGGEALLLREKTPEVEAAVEQARDAVAAATRELDACFHRITFVGLPEEDLDKLTQLHPPTNAQIEQAKDRGEDMPLWNDETFYPALLEMCAQDSELSAAEWADELAQWTRAERRDIRAKVMEANIRSYATALSFV